MSKLFEKLNINSKIELVNRLAVAPMTTSQSNSDGTVSEAETIWLERLAKDNYGMIITCAANISKNSIAFPNQLSVASDDMLIGLSKLASKLNVYKSKTIVQLCHAGSRALEHLTDEKPCSASSYTMPQIPNFIPPKTLSKLEIENIINDFVNACIRVSKAGFNGIEIHGANGYLFTQFFSKMTNLREDEYGGSLINRARFAREVVKESRKKVPADFIIGFRMSFENAGMETGLDIDENIQIINWLLEDGIDYVHISHLNYKAKSVKYPEKIALQYIRQKVNKNLPVIGVGSIFSVEDAELALEYGADIVAIGRAAIGNQNLPDYFLQRKALNN